MPIRSLERTDVRCPRPAGAGRFRPVGGIPPSISPDRPSPRPAAPGPICPDADRPRGVDAERSPGVADGSDCGPRPPRPPAGPKSPAGPLAARSGRRPSGAESLRPGSPCGDNWRNPFSFETGVPSGTPRRRSGSRSNRQTLSPLAPAGRKHRPSGARLHPGAESVRLLASSIIRLVGAFH